ncbi:MAG: hypothetical protein ACLFNI_12030 [Natronomonas sp.]
MNLSAGEVFDLLKNERRRRVIQYLKTRDDRTASLSRLSTHIAALENDVDETQVSSDQRRRVYISLYQLHLPKLENYGVVEFHQESGSVTLDETGRIDHYLDPGAPQNDVRLELILALLVGLTVTIGLLGIGPFDRIPLEVWTILSTGVLIGLVVYRYYTSSK